jgi:hypothetical protein
LSFKLLLAARCLLLSSYRREDDLEVEEEGHVLDACLRHLPAIGFAFRRGGRVAFSALYSRGFEPVLGMNVDRHRQYGIGGQVVEVVLELVQGILHRGAVAVVDLGLALLNFPQGTLFNRAGR